MPTLVHHLCTLRHTGIVSSFTLVYIAGLVHIQFWLNSGVNTLVIGDRTFKETTEFSSEDDLLTELWSSERLVEVVVKTMS